MGGQPVHDTKAIFLKAWFSSSYLRVLVPGDATEAGVFSLRPATAYHIRIVAENELGTSEPSETVTIITAEEAPTGPPQDVKVDAVDKHTLRVTWKPPPPQDWNGELQG